MAENRIYSIDWLKGVMILIIVIFHSYFFPSFRGYLAVEVFFFISGYFMMLSYLRKPTTAVKYTWRRIRRMAIPFIISLLLACTFYIRSFPAVDSYDAFIEISGELFSTIPFAKEFTGFLTQIPFLLVFWFLSVLVISSFLLYGILQYDDRLATMVIFPAIILFGYNAIFTNSECLDNFTRVGYLGVPLLRGLCGMAAGALICHVYVHHKDSIEKRAGLINVFGIIAFILFIALLFTEEPLDKYIVFTIPWILQASVIDSSWLNTALRRIKGGLFARIGRFTVYVYCIHGVTQTALFWFNDHLLHHALDGTSLFIAYLMAVTVASVVLYYLSQVVTRLIKIRES